MASATSSFWRDGNRVPITNLGLMVEKMAFPINANNTTVNPPLFTITGTVLVTALYGVVKTALGVNNTAASFRINDQTAQTYLTLLAGTTLSAAPAGSVIIKTGLAAAAVTLKSSAAAAILESATVNQQVFTPVMITAKVGALTQIEFKYTTTDTPTTGVMDFYCAYIPISDDANIVAV